MRQRVYGAVHSELLEKRTGDNGAAPVECAVQFIAGAFFAVLAWWMASDTGLSPTQIDTLFQRMAMDSVNAKTT